MTEAEFVERRRTSTISIARIFDGISDGISIFRMVKFTSNQSATCAVDDRVGMRTAATEKIIGGKPVTRDRGGGDGKWRHAERLGKWKDAFGMVWFVVMGQRPVKTPGMDTGAL
jgi:hypothetical protein